MQIEIKFKKIHPDAQLPVKKHGNRPITPYEQEFLRQENARFEQERPEQYAMGYRIAFPTEVGPAGTPTDIIIGTGDTGYDVYCVEDKTLFAHSSVKINTGLEVAYITPGYWFKVESRSSLGFNNDILNFPGVVDNAYRGIPYVKMFNLSEVPYEIKKGDRIAQIVLYPVIDAKMGWSDDKVETVRNDGGLGSSGK
jgi:dUTP pyrophosphatase